MVNKIVSDFLSRTTAHGVSHLQEESLTRRLFWAVVCIFIYGCLCGCIVQQTQEWLDPTNSRIDVRLGKMYMDFDHETKSYQGTDNYPHFVFCIPYLNFSLQEYNDMRVRDLLNGTERNLNFKPTLFVSRFDNNAGRDSSYGVCDAIHGNPVEIVWGRVRRIDLYFRLREKQETPIDTEGMAAIFRPKRRQKLDVKMSSVRRTIFNIEQATEGYPPGWKNETTVYDRSHCLDLCINQEMETKYGCVTWAGQQLKYLWKEDWHSELDKHCNETDVDYPLPIFRLCKTTDIKLEDCVEKKKINISKIKDACNVSCLAPRAIEIIRFNIRKHGAASYDYMCDFYICSTNLINPTTALGISKTVSLEEVVKLPKMTWHDWLASVGGFLGLMVGVSVITFIEFLEFLVKLCGAFHHHKKKDRVSNESHK